MSAVNPAELSGANALLYKLCCRLTGGRSSHAQTAFARSIQTLCASNAGAKSYSLLACSHAVERALARASRQRDAVQFRQLLARLRPADGEDTAAAAAVVTFLLNVGGVRAHVKDTTAGGLVLVPSSVGRERLSRRIDDSSTAQSVDVAVPAAAKSTQSSALAPATAVGVDTRHELLREVLFALRGVDGRLVRIDGGEVARRLALSGGEVALLRALVRLGWLHRRVSGYCRTTTASTGTGLAAHALSAAVAQQLDNYYQLLAVLESQLMSSPATSPATLRRLHVCTYEPGVQLCQLAALLDRCDGVSGGALISQLHAATRHGDAAWCRSVRHLLSAACRPLLALLGDWLLDGELNDRHGELFVECDAAVPDDRLWHDKYSLRTNQVPAFLSAQQAQQVLVAGKSVNFLRRVCGGDSAGAADCRRAAVLRGEYDSCAAAALDCDHHAGRLGGFIERVYLHTSRRVLDALYDRFQLRQHMDAVRHFLLLARGDFAAHLMELLAEELARPAAQLYLHNLTAVLETAVRATNAQHAPADVLRRLDVRVLARSPGDVGWDVFSLDYHSDGPARTVLTHRHMTSYLMLFHALWRCKRLEFTLGGVWRRQAWLTRSLRRLRLSSVAAPLLHTSSTLTAQMVHFIRQLSYYTAFEVLECSWAELQRGVTAADSLDQLLTAHGHFVAALTTGALLDEQSAPLLLQLRTIYNVMLEFELQHAQISRAVAEEVALRDEYDARTTARATAGQFATDSASEQREHTRRRHFERVTLPATRSRFETMALSYQRLVVELLMAVSSAARVNDRLQCLSFRLDFSRHYEQHEPRLSLPFTYQQRRLSSNSRRHPHHSSPQQALQ